jgi:hypothetical protein
VVGFENVNAEYVKEHNCQMAVSGMLAIQMSNGGLRQAEAVHNL